MNNKRIIIYSKMSRASNNYDQLFRYIIVGDMGKTII